MFVHCTCSWCAWWKRKKHVNQKPFCCSCDHRIHSVLFGCLKYFTGLRYFVTGMFFFFPSFEEVCCFFSFKPSRFQERLLFSIFCLKRAIYCWNTKQSFLIYSFFNSVLALFLFASLLPLIHFILSDKWSAWFVALWLLMGLRWKRT